MQHNRILDSRVRYVRFLTVIRRENVICSVEAQHGHLHRLQLVDGAGVTVVIVVSRVAEHFGRETFVKLSDGFSLKETEDMTSHNACDCQTVHSAEHEMCVFTFITWSMS